ncbi:hypothetical protein [Actinoplanes palleronii]|uniref:Uncharacterized protein n=1 Tax=Actinoplanes palleronii TaxID=113570 RepID=A0ABQ4BJM2_9ACTN|nr:hypothetical protein [Actinoplanes palleronii]GIE70880.1 hypothetical protein Apa02nite_069880 [Actinoplanes palleronii]
MITVQRVRVRWTAESRGAPQANARRGLCRPAPLPLPMPPGAVVVHDVLADERAGYLPRDEVTGGDDARDLDLLLSPKGAALAVDRLPGHYVAYPQQSGPARLFTLLPGQIGRYRANFRFTHTTCPCNPSWYYEDWLVHIANGPVASDAFTSREPDHDVDHRVHLYGGKRRPAAA